MRTRVLFSILAGAYLGTVPLVYAQSAPAPTPYIEDIIVYGVRPLSGLGLASDKIAGTVQTLLSTDFDRTNSFSTLDTMAARLPSVNLSDVQGNDFFQDLRYRGFAASPVPGTSQGVAVYQNGIRINEAFGDTVNWDLIPEAAINRLDLWSGNPIFGLNAIGGAVNIAMKNGFTWQGLAGEVQGGSYGRAGGSLEYGVLQNNFSLFVAVDGVRDSGRRYFSGSDLERLYADAGYRTAQSEFHLVVSGALSSEGVVGPTPFELAQADDRAVYTSPQVTGNKTGTLALSGKSRLAGGWELQGNVYLRAFSQNHVDGNDGDFESCSARSSYGGDICLEDDAFGTPAGGKTTAFRNQFVILDSNGTPYPFVADTPYGTIDRTSTRTTTIGTSLQAASTGVLFGHGNYFTVGGTLDYSRIRFSASSQLGYIYPDLTVGPNAAIPGSGAFIHALGNIGYAPVLLSARTTYYGLYAVDAFDITHQLTLNVGARFNIADIDTNDRSGAAPELNGDHSYKRVNPVVGLTYKIIPAVSAYGSYAEANRAPTPLELDCADATKPCLLENSLVSDPPLHQVVSHTYEAGFRGETTGRARLKWNVGVFRNVSHNDIIPLASVIQGRGYYTNVPDTRRQGVEVGGQYQAKRWMAYLNYSYIDATYRFTGDLASPNSPAADATGNIHVIPGNHIPNIPAHQLKFGGEYSITEQLKFGADINVLGSQYYAGDDSNQNAKLPSYWVANIHGSYQATKNIQVFALVNNLFNRRYATYGTYFESDGVANAIPTAFSDPRTITLAQPISAYGGVKFSF